MEDRDLITNIQTTESIHVAERVDSAGGSHGQATSGEQQQTEEDAELSKQREELHADISYIMELGRLILEKRNLELSLYTGENTNEIPDNEEKENLHRIIGQIAELEHKIQALDSDSRPTQPLSEDEITETYLSYQIDRISKLLLVYREYHGKSRDESTAIEVENFPQLDKLMKTKRQMLMQIRKLQQKISLSSFDSLSEDHPKKIQANDLLADINNELNKIIDMENKNSVELESQRKEIRKKLGNRGKKVKALNKYSSKDRTAHFIDTKK
ncbi:MAG: hypothetical protein K8S56_06155 [Candidatus Cloacimonetes bacterium]|nr:hypothetical protein [Candidatus Cloacimonadota bacterium]